FTRSLDRFAPILTEIVEYGIERGEFNTLFPRESVELLFCASELIDPRMFTWQKKAQKRKETAFFWMLEITLGITPEAKKELYELAEISEEVFKNND
ncbi:MAG: hypothetical protein LIO44_03315, partial [Eubacterium sp.]|nr:hypothetical protein [Eubacterium sp.]